MPSTACLLADIDRGARRTFVPVGRGNVDDAAAALRLHDAQFVLHAQDRAEHIGVERRCIAFGGLLGDRARLAFGAGVVDRDIEPAEACDGLVDQIAHVVFVAHVGVDELGLDPRLRSSASECLAGLSRRAGNDHLGALLGKGKGGGAADAGQCAGDQYDGAADSSSSLFIRRAECGERQLAA